MGYDVFDNARHEYESCLTRDERKKFFVRYALMAPSPLNCQPWLFRMRGDAIELYVDRSRELPQVEALRRLLYISAGTALRYLETALNCVGVTYHIQLFPNFSDWALIASIHLWPSRFPSEIPSEQPVCTLCNGEGIPERASTTERQLIETIAREENVRIRTVSHREEVQGLIELARSGNASSSSDTERYLRASPRKLYRSAGFHTAANGTYPLHPDLMIDPLMLGHDAGLPERLIVISSFADNAVSRVMAGRALGRLQLLYHPQGRGLFAFTELIDNTEARASLAERVDCDRYPQVVVAERKTAVTKPLPRRSVAEMIR